MKTKLILKLLLGLVLAGLPGVAGAISVGASGSGTNSFNTLPPVTDWSTYSYPGGANATRTDAEWISFVNSNSAANITTVLDTKAASGSGGNAYWRSDIPNNRIVTQPTGNAGTLLMATLINGSGFTVNALDVTYEMSDTVTGLNDVHKGHRLFYSTTGLTNGWTFFGSVTNSESNTKNISLTLPSLGWVTNSPLYLIWADENGVSPDGDWSIDNISFTPVGIGPLTITSQPQSITNTPGTAASFTVGVSGLSPYYFTWYFGANPIGGANSATYTIPSVGVGNAGQYHVVVSNSITSVTSSNAFLTVTNYPVVITNQPQGNTIMAGNPVSFTVGVSGTPPFFYQWFRGASSIANATNQSYTVINAQVSDTGNYSVQVSNLNNSVTSSNASLVVIPVPSAPWAYSNVWKYNQSNVNLGTAWKEIAYDDSGWSSGQGILAVENCGCLPDTIRTPLLLTFPGNASPTPTYYFRTQVVLTSSPSLMSYAVTNVIDDGAVFYVNGVEVYRFGMPAGPITHTTLAAQTLGDAVAVGTTFPSAPWIQGTNILAVEVHQSAPASSDITFGMKIMVTELIPASLSITSQPVNLTVGEAMPATFQVGVSGTAPSYRWFKDGTPIVGATSATYTIPVTTTAHSGTYFVLVSNEVNSVFSSNAVLIVTGDTNRPTLVKADVSAGPSNVLVSFSELVSVETANDVNNYSLQSTTGVEVPIYSATLQNGTNVLLNTGARAAGVSYILTVNNVRDLALDPNIILPDSVVALQLIQTITFGALGNKIFGDAPFPVSATSSSGLAVSFNIVSGPATLSGSTITLTGAGTVTVRASQAGDATYSAAPTVDQSFTVGGTTVVAWGRNDYGQTTVPAGLSGVTAIAAGYSHTVALKIDGTVVAWGSQTTVPAGLSGVTAIAAGAGHTVALKNDGTVVAWGNNGNGQTNDPFGLSGVTAIAAGGYHTVALIDVVVPDTQPRLQVTHSAGGALTLNWTGTGYTLQQSAELLGTNTPWADVPGPVTTSPYTTNNPAGSRFFRLRP